MYRVTNSEDIMSDTDQAAEVSAEIEKLQEVCDALHALGCTEAAEHIEDAIVTLEE